MQFNSIEFIFGFLPIFLFIYYIIRPELRSTVMVLGSLCYYALASGGNYWWVAILAVMTVFAYFAGISMAKRRTGGKLAVDIVLMAALLIFFKLYKGGQYLPSGMSFYLFQIAAYLIDIYRRKLLPERKFMCFAEQITMFPKLLSGPLMDPRPLRVQSRDFRTSPAKFHSGLQVFILGLFMKVVIANRLGGLWSQASLIGYEAISTPAAWIALVAYAMRLYFDFYGYSLMAVGIGRMLGFSLPHNFIDPYASRTVSEFYRRWHATLGKWFKDYLYIPLGGNRKGTLRTILNIMVVWLFTGLWHGIGGSYLLWAGFICLLIINERLWLGGLMQKSRVLCHLYVPFVILLSWIPFAIGDWGQMVTFCARLVGLGGNGIQSVEYIGWISMYAGLMIFGLILMTPWPRKLWEKVRNTIWGDLLVFCLFWVAAYYVATAAQDPFMYFQY